MEANILISLIINAALLLGFSFVHEFTYLLPSKYRRSQLILNGVLISLICIAIMNVPFAFQPGIMFDTRSILISVTALIFGPIPTIITVVVAVIMRMSIGGVGTLTGITIIVTSAVIGLAWRRWLYPTSTKWRWFNIFAMSIIVHITMLACLLLLPYPDSLNAISVIAIPVILIYPIVSVLLSSFLIHQQTLEQTQDQLKQSEEKFRLLFDKAPLGYQSLDFEGQFIDVNQQWCNLLGYSKDEVVGKWFGDFLSPAYREAFRQRFPIFKEQGYIHSEFKMLNKSGEPLFISFEGKIGYDFNGDFKQTHCILQDITDQIEAEKALKKSEERYRQLSEKSRTFTWEVDEQGLYTFVDNMSLTVIGYRPEELILKKHFYDIWNEDDRENLMQTAFDVFEQKGLFNRMENEALTKTGEKVVLSTTGFPVLKDDGSLVGYRGSDTDITLQKKMERSLIQSHDLMRYIIEHNRSAVAVHDRDLKYLYVSQRYLDEYKIKDKNIIGKHHYEVFPDLPQKWRNVHQKALLGEITSEDKDIYLREDGSFEWTRWECRPWYEFDGSIGGIIVYTEVITDQVQLLEDLKDKEYNLKIAQEIAHVGSFYYDPINDKLECSDEGLNIIGITNNDFSGEKDAILQFIHPDDRDHALEISLEAMTKKKVMSSVLRIIRQDGQERIVDFRVQSVFNENNNHFSTTGTIQDITDIKKAEENLIYLNNHDSLTGLYNRRYFEKEIQRLNIKDNLPLSIIMADTDGLKIINDSFGHDVGDELLKNAAGVIKQACRAENLIVRYGGDEFIVVLLNTNNDEALRIASFIPELSSKEKIKNIELSISYGCATKYSMNESINETIANAENHMYSHKLSERSSSRSKTIEIIMNTLFIKSHRESQHSLRVSKICEEISVKMKFKKQEVNKIRISGLVHDIGKIGIDEKISNKNDKLDDDERNEIIKHAEAGWRILSSSKEFAELAQCVLHHHERWDGNGYPKRIKGEDIPIEARIIAVADSYDAMTSERSYKKAISHEEAIKEIKRCSGTQFDPAIVDVFVNKVKMKPSEDETQRT